MPAQSSNRSIFSRIKNIRMPIFQLIFYSSFGYLGYIFYQDYHYKELVKQIQSHSKAQKINPLKKMSNVITKLSQAQGRKQLKFLLNDLEYGVQQYWVDPHKSQTLIDFQMKQLQKSQNDKKIWWIKPYVTFAKLYTDQYHYHKANIMKEGTFALLFWLNFKVQQKNQVLEGGTIRALIEKAIKLRQKKCEEFAINRKEKGFQDQDRDIYVCLNETSRQVASLETMKQRIRIIEENQTTR